MGEREDKVLHHMKLWATKNGGRLFRNSRGLTPPDEHGRRHSYGLAPGSSDLIGWAPVTITPDMVGKTIAQFVSVECKTLAYKKITTQQRAWLEAVRDAGGVAMVARESESEPTITRL